MRSDSEVKFRGYKYLSLKVASGTGLLPWWLLVAPDGIKWL